MLKIQDADPNRAYLLAFATLTRMLESSQKEVEAYLADEWSFYGVHFKPLRACFNPRVSGQPWNSHKAHLSATDITGMRHTAQRLRSLVPEREAEDADFADVLTAMEEMSHALDNAALSKHSRDTLRECLDDIKRAIEEYRLWGAAGIDKALKIFTGTIVADQTVRADVISDEKDGGKLWEGLDKIGTRLLLLLNLLLAANGVQQHYLPTLEKLILPSATSSGHTIHPTENQNRIPKNAPPTETSPRTEKV